MLKLYSSIGLVLALLGLSGCSGSTAVKTQGFLGNYDGFEEQQWSDGARVRLEPGINLNSLAKYQKIMLIPPEIWYGEGAAYKGINPDEMKYVTDTFVAKIKEAFTPAIPFVNQPGPDVVVVRAAITGVERMYPKRSAIGYIPIALLFEAGKGAISASKNEETIVYRASLEAEIYDSVSGQRLMSMIDRRQSEKRTVPEGGKHIEDIEQVMTYWAARFRKNWDKAHGKQ